MSLALIDMPSKVWLFVFEQYDYVFKTKADGQKDAQKRKKLLDLNKWYQQDLPALISSRAEKHITDEELAKLMTWKLSRGKFRPGLQKLVEENAADAVAEASKKAFKALPNLKSAIEALTVLRGVGPATASAVLAAGAPEYVPFMADESMMALPGLQPLQYTLGAFLSYAEQVIEITQRLQEEDPDFGWTPHHVELALWTVQMAKTLKLDKVLALIKPTSTSSKVDARDSQSVKRKIKEDDVELKKKKSL